MDINLSVISLQFVLTIGLKSKKSYFCAINMYTHA